VKLSNAAIGTVLGVCGLALPARAGVFNPNFPVTEVHAEGPGNTAGSFVAAAMMAAKGDVNQGLPFDWEATVVNMCANQAGSTTWPQSCNPSKMAAVLGGLTNAAWSQVVWTAAHQSDALNQIVNALHNFGSPVAVPVFGQADHWDTVVQVTATQSGSSWTISNVKLFDGGPTDGVDGNGNQYLGGQISFSGNTWKAVYSPVTENINPDCDPCTSDPWYNRYTAVFDPPSGQQRAAIVADFAKAPGVAPGGMTEARAQAVVWDALTAAGLDRDPDVWSAIRGRHAGQAFEVNGVAPDGSRWDYFLVPVLTDAHTAAAFVQLAADDGAFEGVHVLPRPSAFHPVTRSAAQLRARTALGAGEHLTPGILTWDPRARTPFAKAPTFPYYEFAVVDAHHSAGVVRVSLETGAVIRSAR
jgi:hypothetical protein